MEDSANVSRYPQRRIPHPNLGHVCVAANSPVKMRQAAGLGFSWPRSFWTEMDGHFRPKWMADVCLRLTAGDALRKLSPSRVFVTLFVRFREFCEEKLASEVEGDTKSL
jgi:hypothetical protein